MKQAVKNQMTAALSTLKQCIEGCPDTEWQESHNDAPFSQVLFHTLFYTDFYLSSNEQVFKSQLFHRQNITMFRDYEELEYKKPVQTYTKTEILEYLNFCYAKVDAYFNNIEDNHLLEKNTVKDMPFIELLIYNTRHIQHHAAQLGLRVQQITGKELEWVSSGGIK